MTGAPYATCTELQAHPQIRGDFGVIIGIVRLRGRGLPALAFAARPHERYRWPAIELVRVTGYWPDDAGRP
ncbi:MAG: hypothetical protein E6J90_44855 [Deltaproteobacteria bacterium]|nr:MAG: hypothetical protein E6J90_44855 [Deltaproteobacteria bacterium]